MEHEEDRKPRKYRARKCVRQQLWSSIRILSPKPFTIPGLLRTVEGVTYANVQSYISRLYQHKILDKVGEVRRGHSGEYQKYRLVKDTGPTMPVLRVGRFKKKEREREKDTKKEVEP